MSDPKFFRSQDEFRKWLEKYHDKKDELLVGFYKVGTGRPSMTWSESVDQALCFGWIDGVRKSLGDEAYTIRFSPRRPTSIWSSINVKKVDELKKKGLMHERGLAAFERRDEKRSAIYAYENREREFTPEFKKQFQKNKRAWNYFTSQPPWYQRVATHFVMSAKQEKTRTTRLERLILASEAEQRI
jgi:uncharacterized protein YdeI (YjbR/CyaY-like superfamily)